MTNSEVVRKKNFHLDKTYKILMRNDIIPTGRAKSDMCFVLPD